MKMSKEQFMVELMSMRNKRVITKHIEVMDSCIESEVITDIVPGMFGSNQNMNSDEKIWNDRPWL